MTKPTFSWNPDLGARQSIKPNVAQTKFGDGYELRIKQGLNYKPKTWELSFTGNSGEILPILAFLDARGGSESFLWSDPLGNTALYVCRAWSSNQQNFGVYSITATFEQIFEYY